MTTERIPTETSPDGGSAIAGFGVVASDWTDACAVGTSVNPGVFDGGVGMGRPSVDYRRRLEPTVAA